MDWVTPVRQTTAGAAAGVNPLVLHVPDPARPPVTTTPTTRRGRYSTTGAVREGGPGSTTGTTLCGKPMLAGDLWSSARFWLRHAANHAANQGGRPCECVVLCGPCSYWAGRPTIEAAFLGR